MFPIIRVSENYETSYLLKTDDDTYVNVSKIIDLVRNISPIPENPICLSHFHHNRAVPHWGKWADYDYPSSTYPTFPSGSGYLLTGKHMYI